MERKIGEIFEYNGEWYQCLKSDNTCNGCVGKFQPYSFCHGAERCTGKIFKKLEKVGEPYSKFIFGRGNIKVQRYKLYRPTNTNIRNGIWIYHWNENLVDIEIKQNKEDMEEKKIQHYDCFFNRKPSESNLKPFSLELAKQGKPVCTRDGRKARIICFDKGGEQPIVALIEKNEEERIDTFFSNGHSVSKTNEVAGDLMMLPEKRSGWAKVRKDINLYNTKEEADRKMIGNYEYVTAKVCWEE